MIAPFFRLAAVSPTRQRAFRLLAIAHVATLGCVVVSQVLATSSNPRMLMGNVLLVAGIIEGALLLGWRLTQLPKSQALEFLLVSSLRPHQFLFAEALVGLSRLAMLGICGLPMLLLGWHEGWIAAADIEAMLLIPFAWGAATGLGLTAWAYEPLIVRRWGERLMGLGILFYLIVGVLAGERLIDWLAMLPRFVGETLLATMRAMHEYNPFGGLKHILENSPEAARQRILWLEAFGASLAIAFLLRACFRLQAHFQELHYRPIPILWDAPRAAVGNAPLTWWAVKRVTKYSGRINLWLAGGFSILYAAYILAGPLWPQWLGRGVFEMFDRMGGVPMLTTALVLLAAVPAAFQYGLWDHDAQDRCRRLELLLLTELDGNDYWKASLAAAWKRGWGYFAVAGLLWVAAWLGGQMTFAQFAASAAAGVVLWSLYFALGFRAFSRGAEANTLGLGLTLLLPLATYVAFRLGWTNLAAGLPPGSVFFSAQPTLTWLAAIVLMASASLVIGQRARTTCVAGLRDWYGRNHGLRATAE